MYVTITVLNLLNVFLKSLFRFRKQIRLHPCAEKYNTKDIKSTFSFKSTEEIAFKTRQTIESNKRIKQDRGLTKTFCHLLITSSIFCAGFSFIAIHELIYLKSCFKPLQFYHKQNTEVKLD